MTFLVIGHLTKDIILKDGKRIERIGGGAYYSALALSCFGKVKVLTKIGKDFPERFLEEFGRRIELILLPSKKSTIYELRYLNKGKRILRLLDKGDEIKAQELPKLDEFDIILVNPVAKEISPETLEGVKKYYLSLDLQGLVREFKEVIEIGKIEKSLLKNVKIIHANLNEISALGKFEEAIEFLRKNIKVALISNGGKKGIAIENGKIYSYYPPKVEVKDTTGAGDCFLAVFTYFYKNYSFLESIKKANAFTSLFLERRKFDFDMKEVLKRSLEVKVKKLN